MARPWERYSRDRGGVPSVQTRPADPMLPYRTREAINDAASSEFDPRIAEANARRAEAEARRAEVELQQGGGTASERQQAGTRRANLNAATDQLLRVGELYRGGYMGGGVLQSFRESLPDFASAPNSQFNSAASGLSEAAFASLRVPGVGSQSDAELRQFLRANQPRAQDFDSTIEERLDTVQSRLNAQRREMGLPEVDWRNPPAAEAPQALTNPDRVPLVVNPDMPGQSLAGGERYEVVRDPVLEQIGSRISAMVTRGASPGEINAYARSVGMDPANDPRLGNAIREAVRFRRSPEWQRWQRANPGKSYPIDPEFFNRYVPQSGVRRTMSSVAESPAGAYAMSAGQSVSGNRLDELAGLLGGNAEQARAGIAGVRAANPVSSLMGDITGQGLTQIGAGAVGRAALARAPGVINAALNPFTRTAGRQALASDAAYGAYAGSGDDNLLAGTIANVAGGQIGGRLAGATSTAVGGVRDAAIRELDRRGVSMSIGQMAGQAGGLPGRIIRGVEQRAAGLPVVGDIIGGQYRRGLEAGVQAAHQEALGPIGGTAVRGATGEEAVDATLAQINQAFRDATRGVNLTRDRAFNRDWTRINRSVTRPAVTNDVREVVGASLAQIDELFAGSRLPGENINAALQILGEARSAVAGMPTGRAGLATLRDAERALVSMTRRQSPDTLPALNQARQAYRRFAVVRDATRSAAGDAQGIFTPAQLNRADVNNTTNFGGRNASASTQRPFFELGDAMRQVLPNRVPDSGTAGRVALPAAIVGAGAGSDQLGLTDDGTRNAAILAAGLSGAYTRPGAAAIQGLLVRRPQSMQRAGELLDSEWVRRMSRLIGASALPYATTERY